MSGAGVFLIDDSSNDTAGIHTMGAELVNPVKALDPGLVYELQLIDYIKYLCGLGYNSREMTKMLGKQTTCTGLNPLSASELNYPSIAVNLTIGTAGLTVSRTVTNVGNAQETYQANIVEPAGVSVYLSTYELQFSRYRQQESFDITFVPKGKLLPGTDPISRGKIVWDSGLHLVTSPIAARLF
ncbi:hypothetical protein HPP92_008412 [Vanilla planifolia]|uniref:Subtilisin-like protease fibronectin type-III domain-containing protein n=1 Tax=Vanilla planifolia TaxID=51239 RepID=A0A835R626_VANPL|nr:hypothetical protein HPP92_008412 [Vanilla planifolia]